jgi:hypothetical protein
MLKRLPLVTLLLVGISLALAAVIVQEVTAPPRRSVPRSQPAPAAGGAAPAAASPAPAAPGGYVVIATRNLFSPTRTEAPPPPPGPPVAVAPVINLPKPNLYGVVLQDGTPVAYLEDPTTKRVIRYRVGDSVAGGTLKTINSDSVVLSRPDGQIAVRLHDPTRPRPALPISPQAPGAPGTPGPGVPQPVGRPQSFVPPPTAPTAQGGPVRRPLPPSVLGRVLSQGTDAQTPQ